MREWRPLLVIIMIKQSGIYLPIGVVILSEHQLQKTVSHYWSRLLKGMEAMHNMKLNLLALFLASDLPRQRMPSK